MTGFHTGMGIEHSSLAKDLLAPVLVSAMPGMGCMELGRVRDLRTCNRLTFPATPLLDEKHILQRIVSPSVE